MALFPPKKWLRVTAILWLCACTLCLLLMLLRYDLHANERAALRPLVPVYFLSLPSGHAVLAGVSKVKLALYLHNGYEPDVLLEGLLLWTLTTTLGYLQWFVVLPWIARRCAQWSRAIVQRHSPD